MKIAEETLGGIDVEVHVRPTTGQFTFEIPGEGHRTDVIGGDATEEEQLYADSAFTRGDTAEDVLRIFPPDVRGMFERSIAEAARR